MCTNTENSMGVVSLCASVLRRHATVQLEALKGSREEYKRLMASNVEKAEKVKACVLHNSLPLLMLVQAISLPAVLLPHLTELPCALLVCNEVHAPMCMDPVGWCCSCDACRLLT